MGPEQTKQLDKINEMLENSSDAVNHYWISYSNPSTWQFWVLLALLLLPLIALPFLLDRRKALLIGFYGFNIHVWFHYCDLYTSTHGFTDFPYKVFPFLPVSLTLDTSLVPVTFMLVYQWTLNNNKNFYIYTALFCAFMAFLVKPAFVAFELFRIHNAMNYFYLFVLYLLIALISKLITNIFLHFEKDKQAKRDAADKDYVIEFFLKRKKAK